MQVPFLDLQAQNSSIRAELQAAIAPIIDQGRFILGPGVEQFERQFADYVGVRHCVGVNNGTSALHMALVACDIGIGDEVITTPHTWISTSWAVSYTGARPVFVDIDPVTFAIDPRRVERAITPRTKAILPVHLYGQAADILVLQEIADAHKLVLIEDAAQAHGARIDGRRLGSFGRAGCFSFYPGKNLGAFGEAGALVTNDQTLADRVRRLRDHAQQGRHHHVEIGYNTRMEGLQGAVLATKLPHLDRWNSLRRDHAETYRQLLEGTDNLQLPECRIPDAHAWHLYVVLLDGIDRGRLQQFMHDQGVQTGVHYPTPVPYQPAYASLGYRPSDFPHAENVMSRCLSLPMFPELTYNQIEYTAQTLRRALSDLP